MPKPAVPSGAPLIAALAIVIISIFRLSIPYVALTPGPAPNVVELIDIAGTKTHAVNGKLLLTTVSLHEIRVAEAIRGWFDPSYQVLSRSAIFPAGENEQDSELRTTAQMDESQEHAAAAALALLGYEVKITPHGARIVNLTPGSPAIKVLRRGDVIVKADTTLVTKTDDLRGVVRRHKVGETVSIQVVRGTDKLTFKTKTIPSADDPRVPVIGVLLDNVPRVDLPLAIDIDAPGIGGPSAGLMFALGIVDLLDSSDLTKGRTVAGTGAITIDGDVQPVGGIAQKVRAARRAGAVLFVAPLIELRDACASAGDMTVVGVEHLKEAVAALRGSKRPAGRSC